MITKVKIIKNFSLWSIQIWSSFNCIFKRGLVHYVSLTTNIHQSEPRLISFKAKPELTPNQLKDSLTTMMSSQCLWFLFRIQRMWDLINTETKMFNMVKRKLMEVYQTIHLQVHKLMRQIKILSISRS